VLEEEPRADLARDAGFADVDTRIGPSIERDGRDYPLVLLLGRRPKAGGR